MGIFEFMTSGKKSKPDGKKRTAASERKIDYSNSGSINRYYPRSFDDVAKIIDALLVGEPVVVDASDLEENTAQRVIDLMSGAIYAIDGNMCEIEKEVYVFTPKGSKSF